MRGRQSWFGSSKLLCQADMAVSWPTLTNASDRDAITTARCCLRGDSLLGRRRETDPRPFATGSRESGAKRQLRPAEDEIAHVPQTGRILKIIVARLDPVLGDPAMPLPQRDAQLAAREVRA